jgi:membrane protein implicated in regulation of membrane protease activity
MRLHRAVTLVVMMLLAIGLLVVMTAGAIASFDSRSLIALGVVVVAAAAGGVAFSWRRYYRRVPRPGR